MDADPIGILVHRVTTPNSVYCRGFKGGHGKKHGPQHTHTTPVDNRVIERTNCNAINGGTKELNIQGLNDHVSGEGPTVTSCMHNELGPLHLTKETHRV